MTLFNALINTIKHILHSIKLSRYDRFTISEYFRKQGAQIGQKCSIIPRALGTEPYLVKIGNNVTIANGVKFNTRDDSACFFRKEIPDIHVFGAIVIEDNCVIGRDSILFPNITIGENSIVGARSVVVTDIPPNSIVIGVSARPFGSIQKYREKCVAKWREQKPPNCLIEEGSDWWHSKHYEENRKKLKLHLVNLFWGQSKINE